VKARRLAILSLLKRRAVPITFTRSTLIEERPRSYGDQGGLTMKLASSVQCTVVSQGFVPLPSLAM
jgi:hypothetical protein